MMHRELHDHLRRDQGLWLSATFKNDAWVDANGNLLDFIKNVDYLVEHSPEKQAGNCVRYIRRVEQYPKWSPKWETVPCNEIRQATYTPCAYERFSKSVLH